MPIANAKSELPMQYAIKIRIPSAFIIFSNFPYDQYNFTTWIRKPTKKFEKLS